MNRTEAEWSPAKSQDRRMVAEIQLNQTREIRIADPGGGVACLFDLFVARGWVSCLHRW